MFQFNPFSLIYRLVTGMTQTQETALKEIAEFVDSNLLFQKSISDSGTAVIRSITAEEAELSSADENSDDDESDSDNNKKSAGDEQRDSNNIATAAKIGSKEKRGLALWLFAALVRLSPPEMMPVALTQRAVQSILSARTNMSHTLHSYAGSVLKDMVASCGKFFHYYPYPVMLY